MVDYYVEFQEQIRPGTWLCGYSDDMISYGPSRRVREEGGYNLYEMAVLRFAGPEISKTASPRPSTWCDPAVDQILSGGIKDLLRTRLIFGNTMTNLFGVKK